MKPAGVITSIEAQKKRRNRLSIFLDGEFAFGLHVAIVARFNLKTGDVLANERISDILHSEDFRKVKENAFRYLGRRAHSEQELRIKLKQKDYNESSVSEVINELKQSGFINDLDFARAFTRSRLLSKPMGAKGLRSALWRKGIEEKIIDKVVCEAFSEKSEEAFARALVARKQESFRNLDTLVKKKRLQDLLLRRGFTWDVITEVMSNFPRD